MPSRILTCKDANGNYYQIIRDKSGNFDTLKLPPFPYSQSVNRNKLYPIEGETFTDATQNDKRVEFEDVQY